MPSTNPGLQFSHILVYQAEVTFSLSCHPATPPFAVEDINATVELSPEGRLWIRFHVDCELDSLILPETTEPERTDGLWEATCFEIFLRRQGEESYFEFNFSPSGQWAAYAFKSYREGGSELPLTGRLQIGIDASDTHFALEAELDMPEGWLFGPLDINVTAVIEEIGDTLSYWAIAHPSAQPDFHDEDCFVLALKAGEGA